MTDKQTSNAPPREPTREHGLYLLTRMVRIRKFEEKAAELYTRQKIRGFLHLYTGEEAVAVGVCQILGPEDPVVGTYREHGHALARNIPAQAIMAEMYGKQEGCSRGRGGSMHLFDKKTRFYGGNAIVGGGLPLSVGLGLAEKMRCTGNIVVCFFGEGAVAEGEFHESMNLAALWDIPVLFVCENNLYAMGTALDLSESQTDLTKKAAVYGMPAQSVDGMDVLAVEGAARQAAEQVRTATAPYFLECRTYRFRAHSMFDPELYRSKTEVEEWKKRCPISALSTLLKERGLADDKDLAAMESRIDEEIKEAVDVAENGTWEPTGDLTRFVLSGRREP
ncbi:pyruvate dehydrogenase (acetyl-transferring) E1 component subunit alpha [Desulfoplanes sp.]